MQDQTRQTVRDYVVNNLMYRDADGDFSDATSFLDAGLIDSTGILELVGFLEKTFAFSISDGDIVPENLDSVEQITEFVERKRSEQAAAASGTGVAHAR